MNMSKLPTGTVLSIQVGKPSPLQRDGNVPHLTEHVLSGIVKTPVKGPVWCGKLNLEGDGQADLVHHGGVDKAVLLYDAAHYNVWRDEMNLPEMSYGGFGENLSIQGFSEKTVCIGDKYKVGNAILEVSQPRRPCWKLESRWRLKGLLKLVEETAWSGWYARVLQEGNVCKGDPISLIERSFPKFTVEYVTRVVQKRKDLRAEAQELSHCPALADSIREVLVKE